LPLLFRVLVSLCVAHLVGSPAAAIVVGSWLFLVDVLHLLLFPLPLMQPLTLASPSTHHLAPK